MGHMNKRLVSAAAVVTVLVLAGCGHKAKTGGTVSSPGQTAPASPVPTSPGPTSTAATVATVGETITITSGANTVALTASPPARYPGTGTASPTASGVSAFTYFRVTIVVGSGSYGASPDNFRLVTSDGSKYKPASGAAPDPQMTSATLAAGQNFTGNIGFQVPDMALPGAQLQATVAGTTAAIWKLP